MEMENLYSLAFLFTPRPVDFIRKLPILAATMILRMLDPKSLLAAAQVDKTWLSVCRSDCILRRRIRQQLRSETPGCRSYNEENVFPLNAAYSDVGGTNVAGPSYFHTHNIKRRTKSSGQMKTTRAKPYDRQDTSRGKESRPSIGKQMRML
ncbi:hypothetical protein C0J52_20388 [Blattella germanica]|nr:hypothetical protein C0J52_20388 [Blattella germanica]